MCEWNTLTPIFVIRKNNDTSPDGWYEVYVDSCIADYVQKMNNLGIITLNCCCGHGKERSSVLVSLESKSLLEQYNYYFEPYYINNEIVSYCHYIAK